MSGENQYREPIRQIKEHGVVIMGMPSLQDAFIHNHCSHGDLQAAHSLDLKTMAARLGA
jgi:hypothetical protein